MVTLLLALSSVAIVTLLVLVVGALARMNLTLTAMTDRSRPYLVELLVGGVRQHEAVDAYDLVEAMMTASVRVAALGATDATIVNIRPDPDATRARLDTFENPNHATPTPPSARRR